MFADYSAEIKIAIIQPFRNANVTYEDRPKITAKIARFNSVNSEITGWKLTKFDHNALPSLTDRRTDGH